LFDINKHEAIMTPHEQLTFAAIELLGTGSGAVAGDDEGQVDFWTVSSNYVNTELISGADGTTNCMTVQATYTAPMATTVISVVLYGTENSRDVLTRTRFSQQTVSESLVQGQNYIVRFIICADI